MKKAFVIIALVFALGVFASSCKSNKGLCPAYSHSTEQPTQNSDNTEITKNI